MKNQDMALYTVEIFYEGLMTNGLVLSALSVQSHVLW